MDTLYKNIDEAINACIQGFEITQAIWEGGVTTLTYISNEFFLETYVYQEGGYRLNRVECVDENTARFSLTGRY